MNNALKKLLIGVAIVGASGMPMNSGAKVRRVDIDVNDPANVAIADARAREKKLFICICGAVALGLGTGVFLLSLRQARRDYRKMEERVKDAMRSNRKQRS